MYYGCYTGTTFGALKMECVVCHTSDQDARLNKCPICFQLACDNCGFKAFGRVFCSRRCSDQFFFGDDEE